MTPLTRRQLACLGLAVAVFCTGAARVLVAYGRGDYDDRYELIATFPSSAQGVFTDGGTDVKLRGVRVGTVSGVTLLPNGSARMVLSINPGTRIPASAEARLAPLSVFGPKLVELVPGDGEDGGPYLADHDQIARSSVEPELTDVLDSAGGLFAAADPADVVAIFDALNRATAGQGNEMARGLDGLSTLVSVAHDDRGLLSTFVPDLRTVAATIAQQSPSLVERLADYRTAADLVASKARSLSDLFESTPAVGRQLDDLIQQTAVSFDATVRATATLLQGIYEQRALIPAAFDTVGAFFDMLGAGMRLPGPGGKKLTALRGFVTADLCLVFGVCVQQDGTIHATAAASSTTPASPEAEDRLGLLPALDALLQPVARNR